ncbi:MAG: hypothetical protein HC781_07245 [Leptolyngbyaceae cyanobacterium CSU_1_4]|nr:hypothetical protein [Leptolyngbyaceae cyanobacterium CSU_1_4]
MKRRHPGKIHNYTRQIQGCHYFLSPAEGSHKIYMTADRDGVNCQDCILLKDEAGTAQYHIEAIEHYGDSPTLWTALLVRR